MLSPTQEQVSVEYARSVHSKSSGARGLWLPGRLFRWMNKGSLAIIDQGLISGSNFVISILLARWLTPALYGAYAIAFGIFVLLTLIYNALILEPMSVFGGAAYRNSVRSYVRSLFWLHGIISAAVLVAVGAVAIPLRASHSDPGVSAALFGVAIATPGILFMWLIRRALYLRMAPAKAASGAALYCVLIFTSLFLLNRSALLSPFTALLLMGGAALCAGLWLMALLLAGSLAQDATAAPNIFEIWRRHWSYGRWALLSSLVAWIPAYIFYPLVTRFSGLAASADLRALNNFVSPLDQTFAALSLLFLPHAARTYAEQSGGEFRKLARNLFLLSIAGAAAYWSVIVYLRIPIFGWLYSGKYTEVSHLLPAVALGSVLWTAAYGPAIALRAMESPKSVFVAFLVTTSICLTIGTVATRFFGLKGAIWSGNLADFVSLVVIFALLYTKLAHGRDPESRNLSPSSFAGTNV